MAAFIRNFNNRLESPAFAGFFCAPPYQASEISTGFLFQLKSGLTSAPRLPQAPQTNRASMSDKRTSSGQASPAGEQSRPAAQEAARVS